jgi:hypothetical protein
MAAYVSISLFSEKLDPNTGGKLFGNNNTIPAWSTWTLNFWRNPSSPDRLRFLDALRLNARAHHGLLAIG